MWPDKDNLSMRPQRYLLSPDRDLQVPLSLPPSAERLACGVGCPDAPGRPGRGRCMARVKKQGSIIKSKALSLTACVTCPLSLLKHREAMFNCCWQESRIVRSRSISFHLGFIAIPTGTKLFEH